MSILNKMIPKNNDDADKKVVAKKAVKTKKVADKTSMATHYFDLITFPYISEKAFDVNQLGQYVFVVNNQANKVEIRKAIENFYKVVVKSVNIVITPHKPKLVKGRVSRVSGFKKAIVTLQAGSKIDVMDPSK